MSRKLDGLARATQAPVPPPLPVVVVMVMVMVMMTVKQALVRVVCARSLLMTSIGPVTAPAGTLTTMAVALLLTTAAVRWLANLTCTWKRSGSKPLPLMVTVAPAAALAGVKPFTASAAGGATPSAAGSAGLAQPAMPTDAARRPQRAQTQ